MAEYSTETNPDVIAEIGFWNGWSAKTWIIAFVVSLVFVSLVSIQGGNAGDRLLTGASSIVQVVLLTLLAHRVASLFDKTTKLSIGNKIFRLGLICSGLFLCTMFSSLIIKTL